MGKKHDLPAMPFYFGDWRKAPEIRALDLFVRAIWFEMLGLMWESTERGYLTLNNKPVNNSVITKMIGCDITEFEQALKQLEEYDVFSRRNDGAIFCRRMVRDEQLRLIKSSAGKEGMKNRYKKSVKGSVITKPVTLPESESENNMVLSLDEKFQNFIGTFDMENWDEKERDYFTRLSKLVVKEYDQLINMEKPLTAKQLYGLCQTHTSKLVMEVLIAVDNKKGITETNRNAKSTIEGWIQYREDNAKVKH